MVGGWANHRLRSSASRRCRGAGKVAAFWTSKIMVWLGVPRATNNRQHQQQQPTSTSTTETNNKNINQPPPLINLPFFKKKSSFPPPQKKKSRHFQPSDGFHVAKTPFPNSSGAFWFQVPGVVLPNLYVSIVNPWPCGSRPKTDGSGASPVGTGPDRWWSPWWFFGKNKNRFGDKLLDFGDFFKKGTYKTSNPLIRYIV